MQKSKSCNGFVKHFLVCSSGSFGSNSTISICSLCRSKQLSSHGALYLWKRCCTHAGPHRPVVTMAMEACTRLLPNFKRVDQWKRAMGHEENIVSNMEGCNCLDLILYIWFWDSVRAVVAERMSWTLGGHRFKCDLNHKLPRSKFLSFSLGLPCHFAINNNNSSSREIKSEIAISVEFILFII